MKMYETILKEGGTIITYSGNGTSLSAFHCTPSDGVYRTRVGSSGAPRRITPDTANTIKGNIFVDARHVPTKALDKVYSSPAAAIGSMKSNANANPDTNYLQLVEVEVGNEDAGCEDDTIKGFSFEPAE